MTHRDTSALRVLVVAPYVPWPLSHGGRLRLFHLLAGLSKRAQVTLAAPGALDHAAHMPGGLRMASIAWQGVRNADRPGTNRRVPLITCCVRRHFGHNSTIEAWIHRYARPQHFDVALCSSAVLGQHVPAFNLPVVWDPVDELVLYAARRFVHAPLDEWLPRAYAAALYAFFERDTARRAATTLFTSTVDASYARRWAPEARIETLSNGVDLAYFRPRPAQPDSKTVLFVGSLEFAPNVDGIIRFALRIWPRLHRADSARRLLIVGRKPVPQVLALSVMPGVQVVADAPDVRPYLAQARAVIVPTRFGGGVKNKILEACAAQRAVVASPRALGGLSARPGADVLRAADRAAWIRHLTRLLEQPAFANRIAQSGRAWVQRAHRWQPLSDRLFEILVWAAGRPKPDENRKLERQPRVMTRESSTTKTRRTPSRAAPGHAAALVGMTANAGHEAERGVM